MREPKTSARHAVIAIVAAVTLLSIVAVAASPRNRLEGEPVSPWTVHIQLVDRALAGRDLSAAELAWHDAYLAALGSRRWEALIAVGDAYLRIGDAARGCNVAAATARSLYLNALFRARQQGSLDGVLRTVEAFAALGDQQVAEQGLRVAEGMAVRIGEAGAVERVRTFKEQRYNGRATGHAAHGI